MASLRTNTNNIKYISSKTKIEKVDQFKVELPVERLVVFVIDSSGSMAGSRLTNALRGAYNIFQVICDETDHIKLYAFNDDVHAVTSRRPKYAVNWRIVAENVNKLVGGQTRLWDAVIMAMSDIKQMQLPKDVHVELVVLTDGMDNRSSSGAVKQLAETMAKPGISNFHVTFLACCGAKTSDMERIKSGNKHILIIEEASADPESISRAFDRARTVLLERRTTYNITGDGRGRPVIESTQTFSAKGSRTVNKDVLAAAAALGGCDDSIPRLPVATKLALPYIGGGAVDLGSKVKALLNSTPGRCIPGANFKSAYAMKFGVQLDLKGGKLKDLLEPLEADGVCFLEPRAQPKGPPLLFVHAAHPFRHQTASSC